VERIGSWPLPRRVVVVLLSAALLYGVTFPVALGVAGRDGVAALTVAAFACLVGMLSALLVDARFSGPNSVLLSWGIGMLLRMGIPLGTCVGVQVAAGRLADAGAAYYFLVFYPVLLAVETGLTVGRNTYLQRAAQTSAAVRPLLTHHGDG
jgi:hypothetical protein